MPDPRDDARHDLGLRVECYSGHRSEETPRRFYLRGRCFEMAELLDRWLAPDHRYFKCKDRAGDVYILRHDTRLDRWELAMYAAGGFLDDPATWLDSP